MNSSVEKGSLDLLRLPHLRTTSRRNEGEALIISARSREATIPRCCLLNVLVRNGTKLVRFHNHAIQGRPVWLEIARQRYRCKECGATVYEEIADLDSERRVTTRFRHPPSDPKLRAWCECDRTCDPLPYLERNHAMVDCASFLVAAPAQREEQQRSGTWATIRYAYSRGRPMMIAWPDGTVLLVGDT